MSESRDVSRAVGHRVVLPVAGGGPEVVGTAAVPDEGRHGRGRGEEAGVSGMLGDGDIAEGPATAVVAAFAQVDRVEVGVGREGGGQRGVLRGFVLGKIGVQPDGDVVVGSAVEVNADDEGGDIGGADFLIGLAGFRGRGFEVEVSDRSVERAVGVGVPSVADAEVLAAEIVERHARVVGFGGVVGCRIGDGVFEIQRAGGGRAAA